MLFAAGLGTRLKPFTDHRPKALAEVNDKTLLEHSLRYLQRYGIEDVIINVHHFADQIEQVLQDNNGFGSWVTISDEREMVLETGGGLLKAAQYFEDEDDFVVMNVDVLTNLDLGKMIDFHKNNESFATLAVMKRESGRYLLFDEHMVLCGWTNSKTGEQKISREVLEMQPFAFSGIQVLSHKILDMPFTGKFSLIDLYLHFAKSELIKGYDHTGNVFIDVGKPDSLEQAGYLFE